MSTGVEQVLGHVATLVAIHQPNFLPWLGYFDKIARADVFVMLDSVQFAKTGGTWSNRVQMLVGGQATWLTMPIVRSYHGVRTYRQMEIDEEQSWRKKLLEDDPVELCGHAVLCSHLSDHPGHREHANPQPGRVQRDGDSDIVRWSGT